MRMTMRACATAVTALGVVTGPLLLAGSASAAPYTETADTEISTSNPDPGDLMSMSGSGFQGGEDVEIEIHSKVVTLAVVTANAAGSFTATFRIPSDFECEHYLTATGATSGAETRNDIVVGDSDDCDDEDDDNENNNAGSGSGSGGGNLPATGAAVAGLVMGGTALVGGGIVMRRAARARNSAA